MKNKAKNITEIKSFPQLRGLMAKYGLSQQQMGEIIGNTYHTFGKKLNNIADFTYTDMGDIKEFFSEKGEKLSIENIFFDWCVTIVNK